MSRSGIGSFIIVIMILGGVVGAIWAGVWWWGCNETIEENEYGLVKDTITGKVDDKVYTAGRYDIGLFSDFIKFPSTWQSIEFIPGGDEKDSDDDKEDKDDDDDDEKEEESTTDVEDQGYAGDTPITTRSEDGLGVEIDLSFQYKLSKDKLYDIYKDFGINYGEYIAKTARSIIRDIASAYTAIEFFYNRTAIGNDMLNALEGKEDKFYIDIGEFQLRQIDLPDQFEEAIELTEVAKQEIKIAEYQQQSAVIRANTLILEALAQANISIIEAEAQAEITIIEAQAAADSLNITMTTEGIMLAEIMATVGLNSTQLLTYLWIKAIEEHDSAYLIICENTPTIMITTDNQTEG